MLTLQEKRLFTMPSHENEEIPKTVDILSGILTESVLNPNVI